jgi:hypothetical protein
MSGSKINVLARTEKMQSFDFHVFRGLLFLLLLAFRRKFREKLAILVINGLNRDAKAIFFALNHNYSGGKIDMIVFQSSSDGFKHFSSTRHKH